MAGGQGCPSCAQVSNAAAVASPATQNVAQAGGFANASRQNGAAIQKRFNNIAKEIEDFLAKY
jgi:1,6-anhydro-N-acetylmuramate kinase